MHLFRTAFLLPFIFYFCSCTPKPAGLFGPVQSEFVMGTLCRISLPVNSPKGIQGQLRQRLWDIDRLMSNNRDDSSLQAINRNPSLVSRKVDKELFNLIALARDIAAQSGGSFDLSVGPLVALWDIGGDRPRVPRPEEIEEAKKAVGYRNLLLDAEEGRVEFLKKGDRKSVV